MLIKKFFDFLSKFHYDKIYRYSNKLNFLSSFKKYGKHSASNFAGIKRVRSDI